MTVGTFTTARLKADPADKVDISDGSTSRPDAGKDFRSIYPVYLPLKGQCKLLAEIQHMLELACFEFGSSALGNVMHAQGWECAEAVELNIWTGVFRKHEPTFPAEEVYGAGKPLPDLLTSVANLRHTAVHRLKTTASSVEQLVVDAESFARLLSDHETAAIITRLRRRVQAVRDELERRKDLIGSRIAATRRDFARRRAELESLEEDAINGMLAEDRQHQHVVGAELEEAIKLECVRPQTSSLDKHVRSPTQGLLQEAESGFSSGNEQHNELSEATDEFSADI